MLLFAAVTKTKKHKVDEPATQRGNNRRLLLLSLPKLQGCPCLQQLSQQRVREGPSAFYAHGQRDDVESREQVEDEDALEQDAHELDIEHLPLADAGR